jgi:hypothetical protein
VNKYLFAGIGSLVMTALLFSFVVELAGALGGTAESRATQSRPLVAVSAE